MTEKRCYTVQELQEILGVSRPTIYNLLKKKEFRWIQLDGGKYRMPVMNGYDAALAIRKMKDTKKSRIPIIAMTANVFAEDIQKVLSVGMNDHVAKPVDMNILVPTMMKYL